MAVASAPIAPHIHGVLGTNMNIVCNNFAVFSQNHQPLLALCWGQSVILPPLFCGQPFSCTLLLREISLIATGHTRDLYFLWCCCEPAAVYVQNDQYLFETSQFLLHLHRFTRCKTFCEWQSCKLSNKPTSANFRIIKIMQYIEKCFDRNR